MWPLVVRRKLTAAAIARFLHAAVVLYSFLLFVCLPQNLEIPPMLLVFSIARLVISYIAQTEG